MPNTGVDSGVAANALKNKRIHVAVGVITNDSRQVLIAKRPQHLHQGGLWEFPGGKVEANETVLQALSRELREELDIVVEKAQPFIQILHDYPDKSVLLDVWRVKKFTGVPQGKQDQPLAWVDVAHLYDYPVPAANKPIVTALRLPREMMITGHYIDERDFEKRLIRALQSGIKLVQLRAHQCTQHTYPVLFARARSICDEYASLLIANTHPDHFSKLSAEGLHLTSTELMKCKVRPVSKDILLGASCHSLQELQQAERIKTDYITLGPVYKTTTHPEALPMGMDTFAALAKQYSGLVFALGGMQAEMLPETSAAGGYGVAAIGCYWNR